MCFCEKNYFLPMNTNVRFNELLLHQYKKYLRIQNINL